MDLVDDSSMPFPPLDEDDDIEMYSRLCGVDTGRAFTPKETAVIYSREIDSQSSTKSNGNMLIYYYYYYIKYSIPYPSFSILVYI